MFRIGFGYDVHRLTEGRPLILGGITIPNNKGPLGHSDGDALIHTICDALLGALALRDIGHHFPDTDPTYKGIDSKKLLGKVISLIHENGFRLGNLDATVCLEKPKINPFIPAMQETLATILQVQTDQVSIKATTNEKMGFVGREEGVACYAVVLVSREL